MTTFYYKNLFMFILYLVLGFVFIYFCYRIYFSLVPALETVSDNGIRLWDFLHTIPTWEGKLIVYILGPMFEELIFREYLYRLLKWKWLAFFVSSVFLLGCIQVSPFRFSIIYQWVLPLGWFINVGELSRRV
ncbi:CPBP family glutamic-type intramembrane protease [Lactococcus lactis]|nr:CPBP family glutamic-type intramembrane protease [Lactococcus lactis]